MSFKIETLSYELSVFSRAVQHKNLSSAARHVGLSQPQISRIVARIEQELSVTLLDRSAKRKSSWLPIAAELAELHSRTQRRFAGQVQELVHSTETQQVRIGTLEGLVEIGMAVAHGLFEKVGAQLVECHVFDLTALETQFQSGDLDLILSSREVARMKHRFVRKLGYQTLATRKKDGEAYLVESPFQYQSKRHPTRESRPRLISNSLHVRQRWIERYGGQADLPSAVRDQKGTATDGSKVSEVLLIGHDLLSPTLWKTIQKISI